MPQNIIGIDIGSYSIKIAQVSRSFKNFELIKFYEKVIGYNDVLSAEEATAAALTSIIEDNAIVWDNAIVGLPGQLVSSRLVTLPFSNKKKIDQTITFELENYIPYELDDIVVDYHVVKSTKEMSKVLVTYAPKGQFVKFLNTINSAGLDPRTICVEGVEFVNLVNLGMVPPVGTYALVDIGHKKTTVTICKGKNLVYTRVIGIGGSKITENIAQKLGIPVYEAEKIKIEIGQVSVETPSGIDDFSKQVFSSIQDVVDDLVLNLRQTFFSYQDEEKENVSGIYLSGGTSRLPGIDRYLSIKLKQNIAFLDCLEFHFSKLESSEVHLQILPPALAIALRGVAPAGLPDINFRRGEFAYKGDVKQIGGGIRKSVIAIAALFVLAVSYFGIKYFSLSGQLSDLNREVSALVTQSIPEINQKTVTNASSALKAVKAKKNDLSDKLGKLNMVLNLSVLDTLKLVSSGIPPKDQVQLDIEDFSINGDTLKMAGRTTSFEAVDKIKTALSATNKFKDVTTGNVRKGVKDEIKFDITMGLAK